MSRGDRQRTQADASRPSPTADFESLLVRALEQFEQGGEVAVDDLCVQFPQHADRLRAEVMRMRAVGLIGTMAEGSPSDAEADASPATGSMMIGPYAIVRRLGAGGMGEVYLARQSAPIARDVALKVIRAALPSATERARFVAERQALSSMQHDGIARVFDAGTTAAGIAWLSMEYVDGVPFTAFCDAACLGVRARVALLADVCDAVQHAHQNGVIHRDLKPGNILVAVQDGRARPKVIDFGLAKALDGSAAQRSELTQSGLLLGSIGYMSPEQAEDARQVDTRADVYSLGALLYETLTGTLPLAVAGDSWSQALCRLREDEPVPPSARVARTADVAVARARGLRHGRALVSLLRHDLDWITQRALAKEPARRYASVSELAADLRRFLADEPVVARAPEVSYLVRKFVRRHRVAVGAASLLALTGVGVATQQVMNAHRIAERDARFDRLALGQRLRDLVRRAEGELLRIAPGTRHDVRALRAWLDDARAVLAAHTAQGEVGLAASMASGSLDIRDELLAAGARALTDALERFRAVGGLQQQVEQRLPWAQQVEEATLRHAADVWSAAIASIADRAECPPYQGLQLTPQLGLIPLRRNPVTMLWEFRVWTPNGAPAVFDADGRVTNRLDFDPVVVLLPGGTFEMGSGDAKNDPWSYGTERPKHPVSVAPFFLGKHELTRGQWRRWRGTDPSDRPAVPHDDSHPLNNIDWLSADAELRGWGLMLPTEAQWEYGARAGTTTSYWTGEGRETLEGKVNLADREANTPIYTPELRRERVPAAGYVSWSDGFAMTAPVDALAANAFGLHNVAGNVWEWCRDPYARVYPAPGAEGHAVGDGLLAGPGRSWTIGNEVMQTRVVRGGSYLSTAIMLRSALRLTRPDNTSTPENGVRIARPVVSPR